MSRRSAPPALRRAHLGVLAIVPLALAACGGDRERTDMVAAATPADESAATAIPAGGLPPRTPAPTPTAPRIATFEEAESVFAEGRYDEARDLFEGYLTTRPDNPWGHYMLGLAAWKSGNLETAEAALDRALALDSSHVKSWINSARVLLQLGREHEAMERARAALELEPESSDAFRVLARAQHGLGEIEAALDTYRHALVVNGRDVWAMNNLGVLYLEEGDAESALPPLARAVQLRPNAPVFRNNLGSALERAGFTAAARDAYEAALRADSTYAKARTSLERVAQLAGDSTTATAVNLDELAELFRLHIQMWRDTAARPTTTDPEPGATRPDAEPVTPDAVPAPDSVPTRDSTAAPADTTKLPPAGDPA